jgi:hypothetical protein
MLIWVMNKEETMEVKEEEIIISLFFNKEMEITTIIRLIQTIALLIIFTILQVNLNNPIINIIIVSKKNYYIGCNNLIINLL